PVEEAVMRELEEETGLKNVLLGQMHVFSAPDRDPRGRTVSVTFCGMTDFSNSAVKGGDDAAYAHWFPIDKLPVLAFDHIEAVEMAMGRLKINYASTGKA
ncbi:MAG: NUDIX hydrolase, partial [Bacteroidetes bacterium]|nr:NUDIX hydrolase [Bacteroidota bacterium]